MDARKKLNAVLNLAREYYGDKKLKKGDVRPTKLVDFEGIARHHNVNIMLCETKKNSRSIWRLVYGKAQHKNNLPTINMGLLGGHCFYIKKMGVLCKRWECKGYRQIFTRKEDLTVHLKEERCTRGKTKIICSGGKFKPILNSSEKVFYGGDTKFSYAACQWIEAQAIETGKHIHHNMCGHGGERMVKVWVLNDKGEIEPAHFLVDGYELETNTVYEFHGCHWHEYTCLKDRTKRQQKRYEDSCQIDWLIKNNGWDINYSLVSTNIKKVRLEKEFTPYPHFIVYDFEAVLAPLNEHHTDDLTYLSRHILINVAVHDTLSKEPVYLVHKNPKRLIKQFIEALTEKQEAIAADVLKQHLYPSDFQMLPGEVQK